MGVKLSGFRGLNFFKGVLKVSVSMMMELLPCSFTGFVTFVVIYALCGIRVNGREKRVTAGIPLI